VELSVGFDEVGEEDGVGVRAGKIRVAIGPDGVFSVDFGVNEGGAMVAVCVGPPQDTTTPSKKTATDRVEMYFIVIFPYCCRRRPSR